MTKKSLFLFLVRYRDRGTVKHLPQPANICELVMVLYPNNSSNDFVNKLVFLSIDTTINHEEKDYCFGR